MKTIYHVAQNLSYESGGLRAVVVNLHEYLKKNSNFESLVITNIKESVDSFKEFPSLKLKSWGYAAELDQYISSQINKTDLLHLHGVFMHAQYSSYRHALKNDIPYVITPHGMLEPWHLNDKKLKKAIYLKLVLDSILKKSNILHAITPIEKENLFQLTNHKNIVEIPNFIHYTDFPDNLTYKPSEEYLLFLSRLHPKKGLDILVKSMAKIENKKIKLKIVGTENSYSNTLKKLAQDLGIEKRIEFVGSVYGNEKFALFANAKVFIAPSYSEAIGMVNLEAAVCKTPVITSYETGINPNWNDNGGIMIHPKIEDLVIAINESLSWSDNERIDRGKNLSHYVIENYSWEKKGMLWDELYNSIK